MSGKEISTTTYQQLLQKLGGGSWNGSEFHYQQGQYYLHSYLYKDIGQFDLLINETCLPFDIIVEEEEIEDPYLIFRATHQQLTFNSDKKVVIVTQNKANGLMLFNNFSKQHILVPKDTPFHILSLRIDYDALRSFLRKKIDIFDQLFLVRKHIMYYELMTPEMEEQIHKIFEAQQQELGKAGFTYGHSFLLFTYFINELILKHSGNRYKKVHPSDSYLMLQIRDYLMENISEPVGTEELCRKFGVSAQTLRNHFKTTFGYPPYQFLMKHRFLLAKRMLLDPKNSMTDIAVATGFANANHFSKAFKKEYNKSPKYFRK
ncbi:AraC family transcriptional regulator [Flammeovirga sp. SubArs3]|uniref:helix-turn-helix domain-containing protein n=1 Tax=Flammeovirga sp. SubArs3 TaxID=2995316 RepID=UPI00248AFF14|nr:AraC family transcriptional regulator [Flammeovirga sp. SubArs3]